MTTLRIKKIRIARPTKNLHITQEFYCNLLGFEKLGGFEGHDGYDGVMIGHPQQPYHLEFTIDKNNPIEPVTTEEDLLIFYVPDKKQWSTLVEKLENNGQASKPNHNPYWDKKGKTFCDPNGYNLVIQNGDWG